MGWIFKDDDKPVDPKAARLRAIIFSLPFACMGIFALVLLAHDGLHGGLDRQHAMGLLSAAIVSAGLVMLIFAVNSKKQALHAAAQKTDDKEKPWLNRKDWANGQITTSVRKAILILWIFVGVWCVASVFISLIVVPQQLHQGNHAALIALIFPVVGFAIIFFALNTTFVWRKFNRAVFQMKIFPAASGSALAGEIQIANKIFLKHGLHLRLSCVRRTTTGPINNLKTTEKILWQDEKWLCADLPQANPNATSIPVHFELPPNLPESSTSTTDGVQWKLEASAELRGPNFNAVFDVPVFRLPETPAISEDPTIPFQLSLNEIRKRIHSKILVNDLADKGKEFIFPAGRNPGFASGASIFCLIWTSVIILLAFKHAPLPILLGLSAIDLMMIIFILDVWLRHSRVTVTSEGMMVQRGWLSFKKERKFSTGEIKSIASDVGATAGHAAYHDLRIRTRDGKEFVLAKHLNSKPEADWLVRQLVAALKPSP